MLQEHEERDNKRILNMTFSIFTKTMLKIVSTDKLGMVDKEEYLKSPDTANSIAVVLQNKLRGNK